MKEVYCGCGQYLTTYFVVLCRIRPESTVTMSGIPCPAKGCERTYTVEKTSNENELSDEKYTKE